MKMRYEVYLWGAGKMESVVRALVLPEVTIKGIVDINARNIQEMDGIPVILPQEIGKFDVMIVTAKHTDGICRMYLDMGLPQEKLLLPWQEDVREGTLLDAGAWKALRDGEQDKREMMRRLNAPFEQEGGFPHIESAERLLGRILREGASLCRFGDGEFEIMRMRNRAWFEKASALLAQRLKEIVTANREGVLIAVADNFGSLEKYTEEAADGIREYLTDGNTREAVLDFLSAEVTYYDAYVSRPYMIYRDKSHADVIFSLWKRIFAERNLLVVEGEHAKSGIGNDLFDSSRSIQRVICPDKNAFSQYGDILRCVMSKAQKDDLILISLGPVATVLAYDLGCAGFQAIDIGQLDNEYDWYRMGVQHRVAIPGKLVAEVSRVTLVTGELL